MRHDMNSFYILQISDFHISEESEDSAKKALKALVDKIKEMHINIKYLIHTGDMINSGDIEERLKEFSGEEYDKYLEKIVSERFEIAKGIMEDLQKDLDVMQKNVIVCCGNHDKARYKQREKEEKFNPFKKFLESICKHTDLTKLYKLDDLNVLVLNTNNSDDKKITCIDCENLKKVFSEELRDEQPRWFYTYGENVDISKADNKVNVIVAHQPLYDICEQIRLPYGSETQTTDFLSALQDFIDGNGIYLCGDKHTSSIAASYIHDIPHYFCGHPFVFKEKKENKKAENEKKENEEFSPCCTRGELGNEPNEIDYNLIEIKEGKLGQVKKLHLVAKEADIWKCQARPIDAVVSNLYEKSKKYIVKNSFALLAAQSCTRYNSWSNLSWRNLFNRLKTGITQKDIEEISGFYGLFCRLKDSSNKVIEWESKVNIFYELSKIVTKCMCENKNFGMKNIINIRGEYSSGKSTFLGLFYIYLLYRYSYGKIDYIPAYFNMENDDILNKIQAGNTYAMAVKQTFAAFVEEIECIAQIEHAPVCYIIDGLDEQDIWSESSQDSIGRVALDILAETNNSKYIMSFCQNRLAHFKNTMPVIKYYERNYVMYFNYISVKEKEIKDSNFARFVKYIIYSNQKSSDLRGNNSVATRVSEEERVCDEPKECLAIRKLRRLFINPGFIYHNYQYLKECKEDDSVDVVYMRYIDQQHQICLDTLGYNFVHYAPAMAYLFTYEGYTYERFKAIPPSTADYWEQKILEYSHKIYKAFIFIKKHKDAREYLLALHYNRELRYFAENPKAEIPEYSIINRLIPRNISIIIKKLWRTDQNKFIIVCKNLIEKRKPGTMSIHNCTLSMLIYILAYLDKIPDYIRDDMEKALLGTKNMEIGQGSEMNGNEAQWKIAGESPQKMKKFIDLNFLHSKEILDAINSNSSIALVKKLLHSSSFALYNRQYMMWYYGDLTIYGENRINNLVPGKNVVNKGIDYYNCFYTLYHKLYAYFDEDLYKERYPLLEYDLFTMWDLVYSRQLSKTKTSEGGLFHATDEREAEVYTCLIDILNKYIDYYKVNISDKDKRSNESLQCGEVSSDKGLLETIIDHLDSSAIETDEGYIYHFFEVIRQLFSMQNDNKVQDS